MSLAPGARLGPYEILAAIGAGGMGEVYRARDTRLDRTVALKVLPGTLAADAQFRERFQREARVVSQLSHSHICTLHDVGEAVNPESPAGADDRFQFLGLEHLDGGTLVVNWQEELKRLSCPDLSADLGAIQGNRSCHRF
jgi:serine/threonine protein kinase